MAAGSINKRLDDLITELGLSKSQFASALDTSSSRISNITTDRNKPDSALLERILVVFRNVSARWLLTGEGEMFDETNPKMARNIFAIMSSKNDRYDSEFVQVNGVNEPILGYTNEDFNNLNLLVPVQAQAGYAIEEPSVQAHECSPVSIPGIRGRARTVEVSGSSMEPVLYAGDWVVCTPVSEVSAIQDGAVHVVVSASNGVLIKYLKTDQSGLVCTSESGLLFPPVVIPYAEVRELWQARLVITSVPLGHNSMPARFARLEAFIAQQFPQFGQDSNNV